jgi:hypothetical protein
LACCDAWKHSSPSNTCNGRRECNFHQNHTQHTTPALTGMHCGSSSQRQHLHCHRGLQQGRHRVLNQADDPSHATPPCTCSLFGAADQSAVPQP